MPQDPPSRDITNDDAAATERASKWRDTDPFEQEIPSALLSKEHIIKYVSATGMLCPFYPDQDGRLKSASYEAWPKRFIRWNEAGMKIIDEISQSEYEANGYELKENSITFLEIDTKIRLPNYIAMRFNLSITHVHRGLLLGTGPLVDPGFSGNLLIPLHNLTSAPYRIKRGVIWFEFTKTSAISLPPKDFEERKRDVPSETYFERASANNPIQSSIPVGVKDAQKSAREAKADAHRAARTNQFFASIGFIAIVGMIIGAVVFGFSIIRDANQSREELGQSIANTRRLATDTAVLRRELDETERQLLQTQSDLQQIRKQLQQIATPGPSQK